MQCLLESDLQLIQRFLEMNPSPICGGFRSSTGFGWLLVGEEKGQRFFTDRVVSVGGL
jgi:hypothetical protein